MKQEIDWNHWLGENSARLMLYARQQCRSEADAEDVLQESLVQLVQTVEAGEFKGVPEQWLSYVYTTIRHRAMDRGRRAEVRRNYVSRMYEVEQAEGYCDPWLVSSPDDELIRAKAEELLKEINPDHAEVIVLKIWGERTFSDIADILGLPPSTVGSRYRYGIQALRRAFDELNIDLSPQAN
ncbi:MAG: sigma-70 family RNA polymerase sigma factor [Akkermansia sp.]